MKNYSSKIPLGADKFAYEQVPSFKLLGEALSSRIYDAWQPPSIFYHHRNGGHIAVLDKHLQSDTFSRFDISQFFNRVTKNKIIKALKTCGFSLIKASEATAHSVVKTEAGFHLPYGFTQSPALASLCLNRSQAGKFLGKLDKDILVSVYVDDIILSHKNDPIKLRKVSENLIETFTSVGFPIAETKSVIAQPTITAFNIELHNNSMALTPERLIGFHNQVIAGWQSDDVLVGIYNYVLSVNAAQGAEIEHAISRMQSHR